MTTQTLTTPHEYHIRHTPGGALYLQCCQCPKTSSREQWATEPVEGCPALDQPREYDMDASERMGQPYE